ncbi:MAG TPA: hypothetical protein VI685_16515 [Candidatus Angelobacter sp.]
MSGNQRRPIGQQGGVNISAKNVDIKGDVVGHDKTTYGEVSRVQLDQALQPVAAAVAQHSQAAQKLEQLKQEATKGKKADDGTIAGLVKGIVGLVPSAVSALVKAFGTPILSGIAGPVTKFVLDEIQGK